MRINRKRLEESMDALGKVGATAKGGLNRVALTDDDRRVRDLLVGWMREANAQKPSLGPPSSGVHANMRGFSVVSP